MTRTILTFATGDRLYHEMAKALAVSLNLASSKIPRSIVTDQINDPEFGKLYNQRLSPVKGLDHWFIKFTGFETPIADQVLFIDGDCLAIKNPDILFDELAEQDFAVQGRWQESPGDWYGDMAKVMAAEGISKIPRFNGGFLYYQVNERSRQLFHCIKDYRDRYDDLGLRRNGGQIVDEVCIALAMAKTGIGIVIPDERGIMTTPWRRIGPVHLDLVKGQCRFVRAVDGELEVAEPVFYHSAMTRWDLKYWKEVRRLMKWFRNPDAPFMRGGPGMKIRRLIVITYQKLFLRS